MLKKYTKYVATAFAVASLSTFMIGCGEAVEEGNDPPPMEAPEDPSEGTDTPKSADDPGDSSEVPK
jgi:hypothetical protein